MGLAALAQLCLLTAASAQVATSAAATTAGADAAASDRSHLQIAACGQLARAPWPRQPSGRRAHLQRLESIRFQCVGDADFLAALGALWLEEGEPNQALIWLERALLLDPGHLGAQADLALGLAAIGQPTALDELVTSWQRRTDIPGALRQRLLAAKGASPSDPLPPVRLGQTSDGRWVSYLEATVLAGYESNLDHSPRLNELTLTPPGGPVDQPLATPLVPRRGMTSSMDLSWQLASSPQAGQIWRVGANVSGRSTPTEHKTDWHHVQAAGSGSRQWGPWRGQVELSATWIGGALNEPYRLLRLSATGERQAMGCTLRLALEGERRTQSVTTSADSQANSILWSSQCPAPGLTGWAWGAAVRAGIDRPLDADRPGGIQRLWSLGGRLSGTLGPASRLDLNLRFSRVADDDGYSVLLEDNARRRLLQSQLSVEWTRGLAQAGWSHADLIVQVQAIRQRSNLALFRFDSASAYAGLRWAW